MSGPPLRNVDWSDSITAGSVVGDRSTAVASGGGVASSAAENQLAIMIATLWWARIAGSVPVSARRCETTVS